MANLLPSGGRYFNWHTTTLDNLFIWLTLFEALALPLILCFTDKQLRLAVGRSLTGSSEKRKLVAARFSSKTVQPTTKISTTTTTGHFRRDLVLGPSASYPDFMFLCPAIKLARSNAAGSQQLRLPASGCIRHQAVSGLHTGPPYRLAGSEYNNNNNHNNPKLGDDSRRLANLTKSTPMVSSRATTNRSHSYDDIIYSSVINDSNGVGQRQHQPDKLIIYGGINKKKKRPVEQQQQARRSSGLLSVTKRLLRLSSFKSNRNKLKCSSKLHTSSSSVGYLASVNSFEGRGKRCCNRKQRPLKSRHMSEINNDTAGRGMSPTSSLSTLIRKFNHDNYTSVCQQFEQQRRKQQDSFDMGARFIKSDDGDGDGDGDNLSIEETRLDQRANLVLIETEDSLNGHSGEQVIREPLNLRKEQASEDKSYDKSKHLLLNDEGIFCRKGGLYYNYCLGDDNNNNNNIEQQSFERPKTNPMLQQGLSKIINQQQEQPSRLKAFRTGDGSGKNVLEICQTRKLDRTDLLIQTNNNKSVRLSSDDDLGLNKRKAKNQAAIKEGNNNDGAKKNTNEIAAPASSQVDNNETIIGNIKSVQELLDKMNSIIVEASNDDACTSTSTCLNGIATHQMKASRCLNGKDLLSMKQEERTRIATTTTDGCPSANNKANDFLSREDNENKSGSGGGNPGCQASYSSQSHKDNTSRSSSTTTTNVSALSSDAYLLLANNNNNHLFDSLDRSAQLEFGANTNASQQQQLQQCSSRFLDDALSLVSVSSEFEYHNINMDSGLNQQQQQQQQQRLLHVNCSNSDEQSQLSKTDKMIGSGGGNQLFFSCSKSKGIADQDQLQQQQQQQKQQLQLQVNSSADRKKLEDLRSPSFLATGQTPTSAAVGVDQLTITSSSNSNSTSSAYQQANKQIRCSTGTGSGGSGQSKGEKRTVVQPRGGSISSEFNAQKLTNCNNLSLLNLSNAKFAAASNTSANSRSPAAAISSSSPKLTGTNTITKQKASSGVNSSAKEQPTLPSYLAMPAGANQPVDLASSRNNLVRMGEFGAATRPTIANQNEFLVGECRLPTGNGNVRARIAKMELESHSGNCAIRQPQSNELGSSIGNSNRSRANSMIPIKTSQLQQQAQHQPAGAMGSPTGSRLPIPMRSNLVSSSSGKAARLVPSAAVGSSRKGALGLSAFDLRNAGRYH